jgi:hypothetical protein
MAMGIQSFRSSVSLFTAACLCVSTMPAYTGRNESGFGYSFGARGVAVLMTVGKQMLQYARVMCCISSPEKWIWTRSGLDLTVAALRRLHLKQLAQKREAISSRS